MRQGLPGGDMQTHHYCAINRSGIITCELLLTFACDGCYDSACLENCVSLYAMYILAGIFDMRLGIQTGVLIGVLMGILTGLLTCVLTGMSTVYPYLF